jgi:TM2 domain-containing membrane protein YozV
MNDQAIEAKIQNEAPGATPAYLLWFFLGPFGGHRFYLGRKGSAIAQLLLSLSVFGLLISIPWWIIDVFLIGGMCKEERAKLRQEYRMESLTNSHQHA